MTHVDGAVQISMPDARIRTHQVGTLRIQDFRFESGVQLPYVDVAYETWGTLDSTRSNAVVICHALTGNAHVSSADGWWSEMVGPGRAIDTNRLFVVASNVLGGCDGSSGPASLHPDGRPYALRFPAVSVRDMVRAQMALVDHFGVANIAWVVGGSLGGMQAWEWAVMAGSRLKNVAVIAAQSAFTALGIGYNDAMRQAIMSDPDWNDGNYYDTMRAPDKGLSVARRIGMLTYRSEALFEARFGRRLVNEPSVADMDEHTRETTGGCRQPVYQIESYLAHQGQKLAERFDANSYLYLTRAMDGHDIGRGRGGIHAALAQCRAQLIVVGIDSDYLYCSSSLRDTVEAAGQAGVRARYIQLDSIYGHDAFLVDQNRLGQLILNQKGES